MFIIMYAHGLQGLKAI